MRHREATAAETSGLVMEHVLVPAGLHGRRVPRQTLQGRITYRQSAPQTTTPTSMSVRVFSVYTPFHLKDYVIRSLIPVQQFEPISNYSSIQSRSVSRRQS